MTRCGVDTCCDGGCGDGGCGDGCGGSIARERGGASGRRMVLRLRRLVQIVGLVLALTAVARELRTPRGERTWHGRVGGVPYDLRPPTLARVRAAWWNPDDDRVLTPRPFGVGWAVNLAAVRTRFAD